MSILRLGVLLQILGVILLAPHFAHYVRRILMIVLYRVGAFLGSLNVLAEMDRSVDQLVRGMEVVVGVVFGVLLCGAIWVAVTVLKVDVLRRIDFVVRLYLAVGWPLNVLLYLLIILVRRSVIRLKIRVFLLFVVPLFMVLFYELMYGFGIFQWFNLSGYLGRFFSMSFLDFYVFPVLRFVLIWGGIILFDKLYILIRAQKYMTIVRVDYILALGIILTLLGLGLQFIGS